MLHQTLFGAESINTAPTKLLYLVRAEDKLKGILRCKWRKLGKWLSRLPPSPLIYTVVFPDTSEEYKQNEILIFSLLKIVLPKGLYTVYLKYRNYILRWAGH